MNIQDGVLIIKRVGQGFTVVAGVLAATTADEDGTPDVWVDGNGYDVSQYGIPAGPGEYGVIHVLTWPSGEQVISGSDTWRTGARTCTIPK